MCASGPSAHVRILGTSSATTIDAEAGSAFSAAASVKPHAEPADEQSAGTRAQPLAHQGGERLFRTARPAAHQLLFAEQDLVIPAVAEEMQVPAAGNGRRIDERPLRILVDCGGARSAIQRYDAALVTAGSAAGAGACLAASSRARCARIARLWRRFVVRN